MSNGPKPVEYWKRLLIKASQVSPDDPLYPRAQAAMQRAREEIRADIARQEQVNRLISEQEMQEARDPGFIGTATGTALRSLGNIPSTLIASLEDEEGARINKALGLPSARDIANRVSVESLMPRENREILEAGIAAHPLAETIGEIGAFALPIGGSLAAGGLASRAATKALQRRILNARATRAEQLVELGKRRLGESMPSETPVPSIPSAGASATERLSQIAPQGFEIGGVRATPPVPTTPTILEMQLGQRLAGSRRAGRVKGQKAATFAKGIRPEFKSEVLQLIGEIMRRAQGGLQ